MCPRYAALAGVLLLGAAEGAAQQAPPQLLLITRESFKPGHMAAHNRHVPAFYTLFDKAKVGASRLGLLPFSGDTNHLLYLEPYMSYAEAEAAAKKMEEVFAGSAALQAEFDALVKQTDALHDSQSVMIALRRNDLSYRALPVDAVAKMRFFQMTTTRVNVGRGSDYADFVKQTNAAREKAKLDEHSVVWQITHGAPAGTFLTSVPLRSLAEIDTFLSGFAERTRKLNDALGGDVVVKQRQKAQAEIVAQSTSTLYAVNRAISRPSPEFLAADPDFWKPKEPAKKEPARK